jgi:hypothetical protein
VYFEVHVLSCGADPQFGFVTEKFSKSSVFTGDGVGDDEHSWGVDGVRHKLWHRGAVAADLSWEDGDVIGFDVDTVEYNCHISINGRSVFSFDMKSAKGGGSVFSPKQKLFPAFSCGTNGCIRVNLGEDPFCHPAHSSRLLSAPPPSPPAPSLVFTVAQYLKKERSVRGVVSVDPVSMWNSSSIARLRAALTIEQMWRIANLCPEVVSSASFLEGLFSRQQYSPIGPKVVSRSHNHILQICTVAEAVVQKLPDQKCSVALALTARILFHRLSASLQLGTCDASLLENYFKMRKTHFLEQR